jgi:hypothetical protein
MAALRPGCLVLLVACCQGSSRQGQQRQQVLRVHLAWLALSKT